ncbi:hypothetical protein M433DRAFT_178636 [Acidomyces richmondensis BFW]|nr:MAG: hypothetical protein FE78DRAFT_295442 [Acidomyces sp. 'richmondensis']KYG50653.1 hypothetical protein M433DRAFT_178636 [Acidomyces richmondensis BFW]
MLCDSHACSGTRLRMILSVIICSNETPVRRHSGLDGQVRLACQEVPIVVCLNANSNYPQCQEYLGLGWCCTVYEGGCYVDLQTSSCGQPGAVSCTELAAGTSEACCPQHTICAPGYNASNTFVRCDINQTALIALASSSTSLSGAVSPTASASSAVVQFSSTTTSASTLSTTSFASSAPTTTTSSASPTTTSSALSHTTGLTATLTAGAIAGIAIGPVAAVLLIVGGGWWAWRKRFRSPQGGTTASNFPADPKPSVLYSSYPNINPVYPPEISGDTIKQEMPSHPISGSTGSPAELESNALHQRFK